jgi:catechol 2,3-dioxygenase-like lactoylglutathione lyase family enzyme
MAVLGVGGVFIKCEDPDASKAWYKDVLGLEPNQYGGFDFLHSASAETFGPGGRTIFAHFEKDVAYFAPSEKPFMVNLMVDDLDAMIARLSEKGVPLEGEPETYDYGKFAWVMDPNGIKIELWQPLADPTA